MVEALAQSLEECLKIAEARGSAAPTTLCVVGDKTVKELKNSYCLSSIYACKRRCSAFDTKRQVFYGMSVVGSCFLASYIEKKNEDLINSHSYKGIRAQW